MVLDTLIKGLEQAIVDYSNRSDEEIQMNKRTLTIEYEKAIQHAGFDLKKIYKTARGQYKVSCPISKCCKDYLEVLRALYKHYYKAELESTEITLDDCFQKAMERFEFQTDISIEGHKSYGSLEIYKQRWRKLFKEHVDFKNKKVVTISSGAIYTLLEDIHKEQSLSQSGLRDYKTVLRKAFAYAYNHDIIVSNPMYGLDTSSIMTKKVDNSLIVYSPEDRTKLMNVLLDTDLIKSKFPRCNSLAVTAASALAFDFCLSARNGEVRSFKWRDIDWVNESIKVHSRIKRERTKDGKHIYVYEDTTKTKDHRGDREPCISDTGMLILRKQRELSKYTEDDDYIFPNNSGGHLSENALNCWLKKFCALAEVDYLPSHSIRFYSVTAMYDKDISPAIIQKTAGHLWPSTTDRYKRPSRLGELSKEDANRVFN